MSDTYIYAPAASAPRNLPTIWNGISLLDLTEADRNRIGWVRYRPPPHHHDSEQIEVTSAIASDGRWVLDYSVIDRPLTQIKAWAKGVVAQKRYEAETGGLPVTLNNDQAEILQTDRDSQAKLIAALNAIDRGLRPDNAAWKFASHTLATANADLTALAEAMLAYVQACFDQEKTLVDLIDQAETADAVRQIVTSDLESGWPDPKQALEVL